MVTIRLARGGAKKRPFYSIVVTDTTGDPKEANWLRSLKLLV